MRIRASAVVGTVCYPAGVVRFYEYLGLPTVGVGRYFMDKYVYARRQTRAKYRVLVNGFPEETVDERTLMVLYTFKFQRSQQLYRLGWTA